MAVALFFVSDLIRFSCGQKNCLLRILNATVEFLWVSGVGDGGRVG